MGATVTSLLAAIIIACGLAGSIRFSGSAWAHDLAGVIAQSHKTPSALGEIIKSRSQQRAAVLDIQRQKKSKNLALKSLKALESIIRRSATWDLEKTINICFFGGSEKLRRRIAGIAAQWDLVHMDFGEAGGTRTCDQEKPSDIRVSFADDGHWSYVGTDSRHPDIRLNAATLNLGRYDFAPPEEPEFTGIVLHEFGHAFGLEHEHQHPASKCADEFDWSYIYKNIGWTKAVVDNNFKKIKKSSSYLVTEYDKESIMHYSLSEAYFLDGIMADCFTQQNVTLSEGDRQGMAKAYASNGRLLSEEIQELKTIVQQSKLGGKAKKVLLESLGKSSPNWRNRKLSEE